MAEEDSEGLWNREDELPVRVGEQELLVEVFGKQKGSLLRTGRTEAVQVPAQGVEALTRKGVEIFQTECGV